MDLSESRELGAWNMQPTNQRDGLDRAYFTLHPLIDTAQKVLAMLIAGSTLNQHGGAA